LEKNTPTYNRRLKLKKMKMTSQLTDNTKMGARGSGRAIKRQPVQPKGNTATSAKGLLHT